MDVVRYTQLLKQAYITIKLRDASAIVISGGTSPAADNGTDMSARTFLTTTYQNGAKGSFDAVGHHPYTFPNPPEYYPTIDGGDPNWSAWYIMDESTPSLRSVIVGKGDSGKKIWATEWGYPTGGGASSVTEAQQGDFMKRGFSLFASYPWAGPLIYYKYHDECADPDKNHF